MTTCTQAQTHACMHKGKTRTHTRSHPSSSTHPATRLATRYARELDERVVWADKARVIELLMRNGQALKQVAVCTACLHAHMHSWTHLLMRDGQALKQVAVCTACLHEHMHSWIHLHTDACKYTYRHVRMRDSDGRRRESVPAGVCLCACAFVCAHVYM